MLTAESMSAQGAVTTRHESFRLGLVREQTVTWLACAGGSAFFCAYAVFHGLHVLGWGASVMRRLSPIPLFATVEAACLAAVLFGLPLSVLCNNHRRGLLLVANLLRVSIVLFTVEILLFP